MSDILGKLTIRQKILYPLLYIFFLIFFTVIFYFPSLMSEQSQSAMENKAVSITRMTAFNCIIPLDFRDLQGVEEAIENARQEKDVEFVYVYEKNGYMYTAYNPDVFPNLKIDTEGQQSEIFAFEKKHYLIVYAPVLQKNGEKLGGVAIGLSLKEVNKQIRDNYIKTGGVSLLLMIIGILVTVYISGYITKKINQTMFVMRDIAQGDLSRLIIDFGEDELGDLAESFNMMVGNTKAIISKVQDAVQKLNRSMKEIQDGVKNQASTSSEQSASISETTTTMEELAQTSRQIAQNSDSVVDVAKRTENAAQGGVKAANDTFEKMEEVSIKNRDNINEIVELGKRSERIHEIMEIINTITDQTKLIAFNAAIEASAAGESGRRFGIVATEIRRLADDVERSTSEIKNKINEIQRAIHRLVIASEEETRQLNEGVNFTQLTVSALEEILNGAKATTVSAKEISLATQQQRTASEQIVSSLKEINDGTKHFVITANQTSLIASDLTNLSEELQQLTNRFKIA
ncbi:MAG: hypothetical protein B6244_12280 [Candidatus Cloacimonetes bacterium 4572_55]|nr:MAG: hypothetical protein B6244_12280 [Candidatus Cloacimonetes bacterium 4572_55]